MLVNYPLDQSRPGEIYVDGDKTLFRVSYRIDGIVDFFQKEKVVLSMPTEKYLADKEKYLKIVEEI